MRRSREHKRFYLDTFNGYEIFIHWWNVSIEKFFNILSSLEMWSPRRSPKSCLWKNTDSSFDGTFKFDVWKECADPHCCWHPPTGCLQKRRIWFVRVWCELIVLALMTYIPLITTSAKVSFTSSLVIKLSVKCACVCVLASASLYIDQESRLWQVMRRRCAG